MPEKKIRVIITGVTGMVGEGVLRACLENHNVEEILAVTRRPSRILHPKVKEVIHEDFYDLSLIEADLTGYDACFFCAGVSSMGMKEEDYRRVTYDMTMNFAETLSRLNASFTFCYVSGAGTDSSEIGLLMWARVKGKTENDLQMVRMKTYSFRPAFMEPRKNAMHAPRFYKYTHGLQKLGRIILPKYFSTLDELGTAMINATLYGYFKNILEVKDIKKLARKSS